ncbi:MAG: hypothetical protein HZA58_10205 [Acidimicrobiia bacterium]|nr:hypothetical protein [Acidimicrobiia bacterium]
MIEQARTSHPSLVVVGVVFLAVFLAIAAGTVVSVVADPLPDPATLSVLALPPDIEVVDAHETCTADACDGEGAVLRSDGLTAAKALAAVEASLIEAGWSERECGGDRACLRWHDLGVEVAPWTAVHDRPSTAAMRSNLNGMALDQSSLVYVRVFRCGVVTACG